MIVSIYTEGPFACMGKAYISWVTQPLEVIEVAGVVHELRLKQNKDTVTTWDVPDSQGPIQEKAVD